MGFGFELSNRLALWVRLWLPLEVLIILRQANEMKDSILKSVRGEAGLGDPPNEHLNNDQESANFILKHARNFVTKKTSHEFVQDVKNTIKNQYRKELRSCRV